MGLKTSLGLRKTSYSSLKAVLNFRQLEGLSLHLFHPPASLGQVSLQSKAPCSPVPPGLPLPPCSAARSQETHQHRHSAHQRSLCGEGTSRCKLEWLSRISAIQDLPSRETEQLRWGSSFTRINGRKVKVKRKGAEWAAKRPLV